MNNKYIFLDFDGVLNSWRSDIAFYGIQSNPEQMIAGFNYIDPKFDPVSVGLLRRLVLATNAKIVISSSWRLLNKVSNIHTSFNYYNWNTTNIIVSMTPRIHNRPRGAEIEQWLTDNAQPDDKYVILDDSADMLEHQTLHFVHTDPRLGFGYDDFHEALKILA